MWLAKCDIIFLLLADKHTYKV